MEKITELSSVSTLVKEETNISSKRNDALKIVAMVTMFIDHLGHMGIVSMIVQKLISRGIVLTFNWYKLSRTIGRIAFPIFAYQVALGYSKTSNRKKYIQRLFTFAFISQVPYIFFNYNFTIHPFHFNIIFMLLVGVLVIVMYEKMKVYWNHQNSSMKLISVVILILMFVVVIFPQYAEWAINSKLEPASLEPLFSVGNVNFLIEYDFSFSYGSYGILMVLFFHVYKGKPLKLIFGYFVLSALDVWLTTSGYLFQYNAQDLNLQYSFYRSFIDFDNIKRLITMNNGHKILDNFMFQERSLLALPFIIGLERFNVNVKLNKYVGYWFYPLHIVFIWSLAFILKNTF